MQTSTQTNSHPNLSITTGDSVKLWSSDPAEQKVIDQVWDKISQDTFNTLSPEEQEEIKEIEKVINEGYELKEKLTDPQMQKMCGFACKLAADYKFAKIYQHTTDDKDMLDRFKANCYLGLHSSIFDLISKHSNLMYEGLSKLIRNRQDTKDAYHLPEEETALLEFLEKVNEWAA